MNRPDSLILNTLAEEVTGELTMEIRYNGDSGSQEQLVFNGEVTIASGESFNLANLWNGKAVSVAESGPYKVSVSFRIDEEIVRSSWEFSVK